MNTSLHKTVLWVAVVLACLVSAAKAAWPGTTSRMAVTLDDLPLQRIETFSTQQYRRIAANLLAKIRAAGVPAIGFVNESKLRTNGRIDQAKVDLLGQWLDAGLDLGNHTYSHVSLHTAGTREYESNILNGEALLRPLMKERGRELVYFRHPYLRTGLSLPVKQEIENFLSSHGYRVAPVTIDNSEWIFAVAYEKSIGRRDDRMKARIAAEYMHYMNKNIAYWESQSAGLFGRNIDQILLIHLDTTMGLVTGCPLHTGQLGGTFSAGPEPITEICVKEVDMAVANAPNVALDLLHIHSRGPRKPRPDWFHWIIDFQKSMLPE